MKGKEKCKILKEIRQRIADENDIKYVTSECTHKGDCLGTCPKCEQELRYLEKELEKKARLGKAVAIGGIAAALVSSSAGCSVANSFFAEQLDGNLPFSMTEKETGFNENGQIENGMETDTLTDMLELDGDIIELVGDIPGDIPYITDQDGESEIPDTTGTAGNGK